MLAPYSETPTWPPNYMDVYRWRQHQLIRMRDDPRLLVGAREYYKTRPAEFIDHWCDTYDPRNAPTGSLVRMPFALFRRQAELVEFLMACVQAEAGGLVEKSRDMGATWVCVAFSVWLWLFWPGASIGWGSRKEQLVDRIGDLDSIFEKMRMLLRGLPDMFMPPGFSMKDHVANMRIVNPSTNSAITGEGGDNIGRGGRKLIYFKDESAHYEHPESIEAALTDNTRVQIDLSSVHGLNSVFHRKREAGVDWEPGKAATKNRTNVFVMDWRDHPLKTQQWYDDRRADAERNGLLHLFAQEVDRDYAASLEGVVIPAPWVAAAIDAHVRLSHLGRWDSGGWCAALDVADEGADTNALARRQGVVVKYLEEWGERDTGITTRRAVAACRGIGRIELNYDCIGIGAGVKSEANRLIDDKLMPREIELVPWNAAAEVHDKEKHLIPGDKNSPLNGDFYANFKAQAWWQARRRFENTWRMVRKLVGDAEQANFTCDIDDMISLPSELPLLRKIQKELSQATITQSTRLKLVIDKSPEGTKSPNLADALVMCFWPAKQRRPLNITKDILARTAMRMHA